MTGQLKTSQLGSWCWYPSYRSWQYEGERGKHGHNYQTLGKTLREGKRAEGQRRQHYSLSSSFFSHLPCSQMLVWNSEHKERERQLLTKVSSLSLSLSITVTVWVNRRRVGALKWLWHTFVTGEVSGEAVISSNQPDSNLKPSLVASDILHLQPA